MDKVTILDKSFKIFFSQKEIEDQILKIAKQLNEDLKGKNPLFLGILNGCFMFAGELFKHLEIECEISFLKISSYSGTNSTEKIRDLIGFNEDISKRTVIILEDIVDTGHTIDYLEKLLLAKNPEKILITSLLYKSGKYQYKDKYKVDYFGFDIPNEFIVGYGLDYDGQGRNLKNIYSIID
ncbi:MAG: hypoxanthine phosphoribosyltransferase [Bacteroidales bacterium]|jgi:hypoxanthine phosphoribosyltransferase|nr:hypoxanthine phosphoribosyltransferase [Bacteroidales bacterium]